MVKIHWSTHPYIKLHGKWVYLYRAVDKYGDTIDFLLRAKRDGVAAKAFSKKPLRIMKGLKK